MGSRIAADRVSSVLLAAQAGSWPVMQGDSDKDKLFTPELYFADKWGKQELKVVRRLHLRYLYVDRRFANGLPRLGSYFNKGETPAPQRLTRAELTKFDNVAGIHAVYRHGPIVIYDTKGLGVRDLPGQWYGETHSVSVPEQLLIGLLAGLAARRRRAYPRALFHRRQGKVASRCRRTEPDIRRRAQRVVPDVGNDAFSAPVAWTDGFPVGGAGRAARISPVVHVPAKKRCRETSLEVDYRLPS